MRENPRPKILARCDHETVPRYDVRCDGLGCGVSEVVARVEDCRRLTCPTCGLPGTQVFSPRALPGVRIECSGEPSSEPARVREGTAGINLGLRGVDEVVGVRKSNDPNLDGKPKLRYRPVTTSEASSRHKVLELAKRQGLVPYESGGRYRTVVK